MAMLTPELLSPVTDGDSSTSSGDRPGSQRASRPSVVLQRLVLAAIAAAVLVGSAWGLGAFDPIKPPQYVTSAAMRTNLVITVIEDGNLESASNVELKCDVEGGTTILQIVPDGSLVKQGEKLAVLDSSQIEEKLNQQQNTLAKAEATKITAQNDVSAAEISVREYLEGQYLQQLKTIESQITIARQNLSSAENIAKHSEEMVRKGYTTPLQHESNVYAVEKAQLDLENQETAKRVLEEFTKVKTQKDLEAKRDSAVAKLKAELSAYDLEEQKLRRLEVNLKKCELIAPQDGMVVYANDMGGGGRFAQQGPKIDLGAAVKQYQGVLRLPDLTKMQVKALVHESKIELVRPGQRARIKIQDRELQGTVTQVASQPDVQMAWGGSGAKEYATIIRIDGQPDGLKPGMTADVTILIDEKKDVVAVPVQCVVSKGRKAYVWVLEEKRPVAREVLLGVTNDTLIELKDGVKEGDLVLQNPRADVPESREGLEQTEKIDVAKTFGSTPAGTAGAPTGLGGAPNAAPAPTGGAAERGPNAGPGGPVSPGAVGGAPNGPGESRGPVGPGGPGGGPGRPPGGRRMPNLKELDKDGDGKVSKDEFPEQGRQFFDMIDSNKDGFIDADENKAMEERARQMRQQFGNGAGGPPGAGPGGPQ